MAAFGGNISACPSISLIYDLKPLSRYLSRPQRHIIQLISIYRGLLRSQIFPIAELVIRHDERQQEHDWEAHHKCHPGHVSYHVRILRDLSATRLHTAGDKLTAALTATLCTLPHSGSVPVMES